MDQSKARSKKSAFLHANFLQIRVYIWIIAIALIITLTVLTRLFLFATFYINSNSMEPTLKDGDRLVANQLSYKVHDINRGDIVIINIGKAGVGVNRDIIKRVIGLEGETVEVRNCQVLINGARLEESYLKGDNLTFCRNKNEFPNSRNKATLIPKDHIFVLGDNRTNSRDSREFGFVYEGLVKARAVVKVWPLWEAASL